MGAYIFLRVRSSHAMAKLKKRAMLAAAVKRIFVIAET